MTTMRFVLLSASLIAGACGLPAASRADGGLAGGWHCPMPMRLEGGIPLQLHARPRLHGDGRFDGNADAVVTLGQWPMTLRAQTDGRWRRDGDRLHLVVERLTLAPGSEVGVELQRQLVRQLESRLPPLPHEESVTIIDDDGYGVVLEDDFGARYACTRERDPDDDR